MKWLKRLLRLVPKEKRPALEALVPEDAEIDSAEDLLVDDHQEFTAAVLEALDLELGDATTLDVFPLQAEIPQEVSK